jgi:hypothetical protein
MPYKDPEKERENARERQKRYRRNHPAKIKEIEHRYNLSVKGKSKHVRFREKHPERCNDKAKRWREEHPEKYKEVYIKSNHSEKAKERIQKYKELHPDRIIESQKKFMGTDKWKKINRRKCNKRQRTLGYNELFENIFDEPVEWHHINNIDVVALPVDVHRIYPGKPVDVHRDNFMYIVFQLYPELKKEEMVRSLSTGTSPVLG